MYLLTTREQPVQIPQWCISFDEQTNQEEVIMQRRLVDGRLLMVMPRMTGVTLAIGMPFPFHRIGIFADSWDYTNDTFAYYAFNTWNPEEQEEPTGWTRHARTGRYRIDGDPGMEYIQWEGNLAQQVHHAVTATINTHASIAYTEEHDISESLTFPPGTRLFISYVVREDCPHTPKCQWTYTTFQYQGRCVVMPMAEMLLFQQDRVLMRLTSHRL